MGRDFTNSSRAPNVTVVRDNELLLLFPTTMRDPHTNGRHATWASSTLCNHFSLRSSQLYGSVHLIERLTYTRSGKELQGESVNYFRPAGHYIDHSFESKCVVSP